MKPTQETIQRMYNLAKELYEDENTDIYWLKRIYNEISDNFWLDISFGVDWCEYWWDDEIYCYVYVDNIWSIVFNRSVNRYTDWKFYKDTVDYLLRLQEDAEEIEKKLLPLNQ